MLNTYYTKDASGDIYKMIEIIIIITAETIWKWNHCQTLIYLETHDERFAASDVNCWKKPAEQSMWHELAIAAAFIVWLN
jgi:hypothetical protein